MAEFAGILDSVRRRIAAACHRAGRSPDDVEIIAVTKTHGPDAVRDAWDAGLGIVGENKVQEAAWKKPISVSGPEWHLIGHLQRNKVRAAVELFSFIHSVDSPALLAKIDETAYETGARPGILLEVNVSGERSKSGLAPEAVPEMVERALECRSLTLEGFMCMAPFTPTDKIEETRPVFRALRELRDELESLYSIRLPRLSMGMTNDFEVAVEEGATWVRLGTILFGERPKAKPVRNIDAGDAGESGEGAGLYDRTLD